MSGDEEMCGVCQGSGKAKKGVTCTVCNGTGVLCIPDDEEREAVREAAMFEKSLAAKQPTKNRTPKLSGKKKSKGKK